MNATEGGGPAKPTSAGPKGERREDGQREPVASVPWERRAWRRATACTVQQYEAYETPKMDDGRRHAACAVVAPQPQACLALLGLEEEPAHGL